MILCAGEALIDMLPREVAGGGRGFLPVAGGAVFNTSIALGRLGVPSGLFTGLSDDLFGEVLQAALHESNVDFGLARINDRPTTLAFVTLTNGQARYAFYDENTAGRMLGEDDLPKDLPGVSALFFGGISLAVEPCASSYEALCLREAGSRAIMLDPNIRPGFIADEPKFRARMERMLGAADIVKVSDEDLDWLAGASPVEDQIAKILERGPALVCLTRGAEGVTAYRTGGDPVNAPARRAEVVDTVGAGDTFNAGVLAGLQEAGALSRDGIRSVSDSALSAALTLGVEAAAVTVSRAGANPPWKSELT
jgi:fructokinase